MQDRSLAGFAVELGAMFERRNNDRPRFTYWLWFGVLGILTACTPSGILINVTGQTGKGELVVNENSLNEVRPVSAATSISRAALELQATSAPTSRSQVLPQTGTGPTQAISDCDLAAAGVPLDVTYPDDSVLPAGTKFTKTWRLVNAGSCTWTEDYALAWFSGDAMGAVDAQPIGESVAPGQPADVSVELVAPGQAGTYTGYWMLRNTQGEYFGIGPVGISSFWVTIQVVDNADVLLSAVTELPADDIITPITGTISLAPGQDVDLDEGRIKTQQTGDIEFVLTEDGQAQLAPVNNARISVFGNEPPGLVDCRADLLDALRVSLPDTQPVLYYCYRTNSGSVGWFSANPVDQPAGELTINYQTWETQ